MCRILCGSFRKALLLGEKHGRHPVSKKFIGEEMASPLLHDILIVL
jgi:hypothetical protein